MTHYFQLNSISILASIKDILSCLCDSSPNGKIVKRLTRLNVLNQAVSLASKKNLLMEIEQDMHDALFVRYQEEEDNIRQKAMDENNAVHFSMEDLQEFNIVTSYLYSEGRTIKFFAKSDPDPNDPRKILEKSLTDAVNEDITIYRYGCEILSVIEKKISQHEQLKHLYDAHKIVVELKGGVAQKLSLNHYIDNVLVGFGKYKQTDSEIVTLKKNATIAYGPGDNDTTILIDPDIDEFNQVHKIVVTLIENVLNEYSQSIAPDGCRSSWLNRIFRIKNIQCRGNNIVVVRSKKRPFQIHDNNVCIYKISDRNPLYVYPSVNKSLHFLNSQAGGGITSFVLLRLKACFKSEDFCGPASAEILDISVPCRDDAKLIEYFTLPNEEKMLMTVKILIPSVS